MSYWDGNNSSKVIMVKGAELEECTRIQKMSEAGLQGRENWKISEDEAGR